MSSRSENQQIKSKQMLVFEERAKLEYPENKPLFEEKRTSKRKPQKTPSLGIEPRAPSTSDSKHYLQQNLKVLVAESFVMEKARKAELTELKSWKWMKKVGYQWIDGQMNILPCVSSVCVHQLYPTANKASVAQVRGEQA